MKLILVQEYSPKEIVIDFPNRSAIITLNSTRDLDEILEKYAEFINYKHPDFLIWKHQQFSQQAVNPMGPGMINPMQPHQ